MSDLPPLITDPDRYGEGFIYVLHWEERQHRDAVRRPGSMPWLKQYVAEFDDDAYRALTSAARGLLHDIRMLVARTGQGQVRSRLQVNSRTGLGATPGTR